MNRWLTPADAATAVLKALATERAIRARHRETVRIAHRQPWLIGSVDAQQIAVMRARAGHTESVERTRGLVACQQTSQRQFAAYGWDDKDSGEKLRGRAKVYEPLVVPFCRALGVEVPRVEEVITP